MDDNNTSQSFDGFASLLKLSGVTVPARARFVGEATFSGIYTGTTLGLVCGQLFHIITPYGPLLPFLFGSSIGFCIGLHTTWKNAVKNTYIYANHYPKILAHTLWTEFRIVVPPAVLSTKNVNTTTNTPINDSVSSSSSTSIMVDWVKSLGMADFSMCVLASLSCSKDVNEIDQLVRQQLIEETASSIAASKIKQESNDNDI